MDSVRAWENYQTIVVILEKTTELQHRGETVPVAFVMYVCAFHLKKKFAEVISYEYRLCSSREVYLPRLVR
jgi:hypothetical protein